MRIHPFPQACTVEGKEGARQNVFGCLHGSSCACCPLFVVLRSAVATDAALLTCFALRHGVLCGVLPFPGEGWRPLRRICRLDTASFAGGRPG